MDNKIIKVKHITKFAKPHAGGIESFVTMFNSCINSENINIEVLCCSNKEKSSVEDNIKYTRCRYLFELASNTISPKFLWELHKTDTDIIIYHMPFIFAVICHFIARPKYKKMIICYHSDIIGYDKIMKPFWGIYKKFLKKADVIHVQSPQMIENSMVKDYKDKCFMAPYLIDTNCTYNADNVSYVKEKYKNKKIIFVLGRHVKYKGFIYMIEAMKYVEDAVLLIGGKGVLTEDYKKYINKNDLDKKVFILGKIPDNELNDYYEACDIFALPSVSNAETLAIVQLEAMIHSKPVINTYLQTGVNYVSINNETGLTVNPENSEELANAVNKLLKDNELRVRLGQNARKRAEQIFDIKKNQYTFRELLKI